MRIRKFQAASMREALAEIKRELGPEALIVSSREVRKGLVGSAVEVTAAIDEAEAPDPAARPSSPAFTESLPPPPAGLTESDVERLLAPIRGELRALRAYLRPVAEGRADEEIVHELVAMRQALGARLATESPRADLPPLADLAARTRLAAPSSRRVVMVVGPTGVGKTTTIAKMAGRDALVAGKRVALVTLDTYRVGGEEQLRAYADLMGVPMSLVTDPVHLGTALAEHEDADRVYVDTAGRSPHDRAAISELEGALEGTRDVEVHLALCAGSSARAIDRAHDRFRPLGIDRLLFTKVDEADSLEELVRAPARLQRPVSVITTGQRVPEDMDEATNQLLLELAVGGFAPAQVAA